MNSSTMNSSTTTATTTNAATPGVVTYDREPSDGQRIAGEAIANTPAARRAVATYTTYGEAQRAVDYLSDQRFPVERVAIVAEGLRFEEQVTGRLGWGRALLNGALGGAATGIFIGFIFGLFSLITPLVSALTLAFYGLIFGAIVGALFGLLFYAFSGGQRDFTSVGSIRAQRYEIVVDSEVANEAERLLATMGPAR